MNPTAPIILIVDDIAANRETLVELLAGRDYQLLEATDGAQALALAAATPPDLILLDVMMPGINGYEVCRRLRADRRLTEVPVVILTALDDQASRIAGIEAGADDFISKPFTRAELRGTAGGRHLGGETHVGGAALPHLPSRMVGATVDAVRLAGPASPHRRRG